MNIRLLTLGALGVVALTASACGERPGSAQTVPPPRTLTAFRGERELADFLGRRARRVRREVAMEDMAPMGMAAAPKEEAESVTNTQHAGVDEGGIVKVHGDFLVMLRRGRLFTVRVGDGDLTPVSTVDAYGPGMSPDGTWYDELLVSGDQVVVIGFSYARGGTEVSLFGIDRRGGLEYRSTYHLRSNDYYSSRNYASRLIGTRLIMYTPLYLFDHPDPFTAFPALRRWHPGATDAEFRRIVPATRVYRPGRPLHDQDELALHTVTVCDLARGAMECEADAVLGPPGRVFYVSPGAVYVWVSDWAQEPLRGRAPSMLYRMPLTGGAPTALGVEGSPADQFSFLESGDRHLNVVVLSDAPGEGMWGSERARGGVALMRVPLGAFGGGAADAPRGSYRALPTPEGDTFQNRFVGDHLLYGTGRGWGAAPGTEHGTIQVVRYAGGGALSLPLPHGVDRIEAMGGDAVVVGSAGGDLHFSGVRLDGPPRVVQHYLSPGVAQGELRSHGFFYKPDGDAAGTIGLPVRGAGGPGHAHLTEGSAAIVYLRNQDARFSELGRLSARDEGVADDGCRASCVDWYGNARPLFLRGRIFALLGYELVEGVVDDGRMRETRRVSYAPRTALSRR